MDAVTIRQRATEAKVVPIELLFANEYNPNRMPDTEMGLLKQCILKYGFLFPIIATWDEEKKKYRIIDGYHRYEALRRIGATEASIIDMGIPYHECVQLTVLMNRIKGLHQVELMSDLVMKLEELGLEDTEICQNLGMEVEEYLRLKQQLGIAHAFKNHEYTKSWEINNVN
jgi:ParB-like chromosome segregation protein Spo0J